MLGGAAITYILQFVIEILTITFLLELPLITLAFPVKYIKEEPIETLSTGFITVI